MSRSDESKINISDVEDWKAFSKLHNLAICDVPFVWDDRIGTPEEGGYITNYPKLLMEINNEDPDSFEKLRNVVLNDLWFIVFFIINNNLANHPFIVQACRDVQFGPKTNTLDLWFRGACKTTVISVAETIQKILKDPEQRIALFSYTKAAALKIFRMVKYTLETSEFLKTLFPEVLYKEPTKDAYKWAEEAGLYVKRKGIYREPTLTAWGLLDGMPTGDHFTHRVYDDILVAEIADSPDVNDKLKEKFDLSMNLGTFQDTDTLRVVGTPYNYNDVLMYIQDKVDVLTGEKLYTVRKKPATDNGQINGISVFQPEKALAEARSNRRTFNAQQLLDPTPESDMKLRPELLQEIDPRDIPVNILRLMPIDPAGMRVSDTREGDSWAMMVLGFQRVMDDIGAANVYILDMIIEPMTQDQAVKNVFQMYSRNGRISKIGVEKVGISTMEVHISNYLLSKGRVVTVENGGLHILQPGGRKKESRIEANVSWPLNNGKIFISTGIPIAYRERLKLEMEKFPYWKNDGLDALAYGYDMAKHFRFSKVRQEEEKRSKWDEEQESGPRGWMLN